MTLDDAQTFCSDPRSTGTMYGSPWSFFYTSLANLRTNSPNIQYSRRQLVDDGRYDWLLTELGCSTISPDDPRVSGLTS